MTEKKAEPTNGQGSGPEDNKEERERVERELAEQAQAEERERVEREEHKRQEQEKRERVERELAEEEKAEQREREEREQAAREQVERELAEQQRIARELAEQEERREREEARKTRRAGRSRGRAPAAVRPTTEKDCKGDPRVKHTLAVLDDVQARLFALQLDETMATGRERPMWPHVDAALAELHPDKKPDLSAWAERAEELLEHDSDRFTPFGPLMRTSTRTAIRTLRVRLKAAGVRPSQHHVVTAAIVAYLDAWDAQGRKVPDA
ncbi:hypothetical protein [Streptosporangium oxazolinicum]|uniref:hypothetical protein n=1 Tax=Streptosporangium oxazolinicum TaxID=909287 RepID=UPI0031EF9E3B